MPSAAFAGVEVKQYQGANRVQRFKRYQVANRVGSRNQGLRGGGGFGLESLLSTHPPLQKRLEQLARIAAEMGQR